MKFFSKAAMAAGMALIGVASVYAQTPDLSQPLGKDTSVTIGKLQNGLTYYIKPNGKPENKIELRLVVKAGSILENDNQQGLAHFMEHMEFNGLKHYPKNELVDYLQKIGVRFGADLNANTGWDRTYFMLPVPTDNPENLEKGFQIVADWAGGALITSDEVNDERHVILEELRMRNKNANMRILQKFLPGLLNGSRYANRMPSGLDSIVLHADPDRIREYYHDWYRPDLMAVIVVGDITSSKAKALIEKYFSDLKNPKGEKARTYYHVNPYTSKKAMVSTDAEATDYSVSIAYPAHPAKIDKTIGDYKQDLIKAIFEEVLNKRLRDLTQNAHPPFANAGFSLTGSAGGMTLQEENTELDITPVDDLNKSIQSAVGVLVSSAKYGFNDADIQPIKKNFLASYENSYNERNNTPSSGYTDEFADAFMKGNPLIGIGDEYGYVQKLLPEITTADINAYAKQALQTPKNYFVLLTGPSAGKINIPTNTALLKIVNDAFGQQPQQIEQKATESSLLDKEPQAGKIVSETKDDTLGTTTYTLSNGIQVTIKPTDFQKDQILMAGMKYGGSSLYGANDKINTTFLGSTISTMGYGHFTPTALSDYLSGKNVNVSTGLSSITDQVGGSSSVKDLQTMFELIYLKLTEPRKDTALYQGWYSQITAKLPLFKQDPQNAFKDSLTKFMYDNNPLTPIVIPTKEDIDNINVDRILEIYKEQFGNADGFHFFLTGNINADTLKPLLEKYIASLPTKGTTPAYKDNGLRPVDGNHVFKFYKGTDQKSTLADMYYGEIPYSSDLALKAEMLGQAMTIQIDDTIREKMQFIYSGSASATVEKYPYAHYTVSAQMPCGPENTDKIFKELDKEVEGYKTNGISETDLNKVKKAMIEQYKESVKENPTWLSLLQQVYFLGGNKNNFLNYEQRVNNVTSDDLKNVANILFNKNNLKAVSLPEK